MLGFGKDFTYSIPPLVTLFLAKTKTMKSQLIWNDIHSIFQCNVVVSPFSLKGYLNEQMWFQVYGKQVTEQGCLVYKDFLEYNDIKGLGALSFNNWSYGNLNHIEDLA